MIDASIAIEFIAFGAGLSLVGVIVGTVLHNRWLDRKLAPKKPIVVVQQQGSKTP